jgi:excisionase family DNA binding protein
LTRKAYYRTGQVAETLGISLHLVRRLIECGLLDAEQTPGGQHRIPLSEVERLKDEGIPPVPTSPEWGDSRSDDEPDEEEGQKRRLLGPPSKRVVNSAEKVVVNENQLKDLKIKREMEETRDWFRERKQRNTQQKAAAQRVAAEQAARDEADRQRTAWQDNIVAEALRELPSEIPPDSYFEVQQGLEEVLRCLGPQSPRDVVVRSVGNAVLNALAPWHRSQDTSHAIQEASDRLPWGAKMPFTPTKWQVRAQQGASDAIARLPKDASYEDKLRVATAAVQPISEEFEDLELKEKILNGIWLWAGTSEERENAREAVRKALAGVSPSASRDQLERIRDQALRPFEAAIEARKKEAQKQQRIERLLGHILSYLDRLERDGTIEFERIFESCELAEELKPQIRRAICEKLERTELSDRQIESLIEELVGNHIDEEFDDAEDED